MPVPIVLRLCFSVYKLSKTCQSWGCVLSTRATYIRVYTVLQNGTSSSGWNLVLIEREEQNARSQFWWNEIKLNIWCISFSQIFCKSHNCSKTSDLTLSDWSQYLVNVLDFSQFTMQLTCLSVQSRSVLPKFWALW